MESNPNPSPIPDDEFNNLGRRVAEWIKGLPKNQLIASVYQSGIERLRSDPTSTITMITNDMNTNSIAIRAGDTSYNTFVVGVNAELTSRWPMSRLVYADFLSRIVKGLSQ